MAEIYFTSDLHFGHKNILKYENRPFNSVEEMDKILIENWNNVVRENDEVYILGDFSFHKDDIITLNILKQLNGNKYLIYGNHDKNILKNEELKKQFVFIKDYYKLNFNKKKFILFHYPIAVWDSKHHDSIHLYGHIHSNSHELACELPNAFNVGIDVNNYFPVNIKKFI